MSSISEKLSIALDNLKAQIFEATKRLARLPGGEGAELLLNEDPQEGVSDYMCFEGGGIKLYKYNQHNNESYDHSPIMELPVAARVEAALRIPQLIDIAICREESVQAKILEVTSQIEECLSRF